jgi:hypothetical protein
MHFVISHVHLMRWSRTSNSSRFPKPTRRTAALGCRALGVDAPAMLPVAAAGATLGACFRAATAVGLLVAALGGCLTAPAPTPPAVPRAEAGGLGFAVLERAPGPLQGQPAVFTREQSRTPVEEDKGPVLISPSERHEFLRRAREVADAPDCSDVVFEFLVEARKLMVAHPHDAEVAIVVAREALRLRHDAFACEATKVLENLRSRDLFSALLVDENEQVSLLGASSNAIKTTCELLRSRGFDGGDEGSAQSQCRAALTDTALLLASVERDWEVHHPDMASFAVDTASQLGRVLADTCTQWDPWMLKRVVYGVLRTLARADLHVHVVEGFLAERVAGRGSARTPIEDFELAAAESFQERHLQVKWLAKLATSPHSNHKEALRRAVSLAERLRPWEKSARHNFAGLHRFEGVPRYLLVCTELARAYVRTGAPLYPPDRPPQAEVAQRLEPRARSFEPPPFSEVMQRLEAQGELDRTELILIRDMVSRAIADERNRVAGRHPSTPPEPRRAEFPIGYPIGYEAVSNLRPESFGDGELLGLLREAEFASQQGDCVAVGVHMRDAITAIKARPIRNSVMWEWRCLFCMAARMDDLSLAEEVLDGAFAAQRPPHLSRVLEGRPHPLDDLVATLAEWCALHGEVWRAECLVRKYQDRGASSFALVGVARGRLSSASCLDAMPLQ